MKNKVVYIVYRTDEYSWSNRIYSKPLCCFLEADKAEYFVFEINKAYSQLLSKLDSNKEEACEKEKQKFKDKYDSQRVSFSEGLSYFVEELELKK